MGIIPAGSRHLHPSRLRPSGSHGVRHESSIFDEQQVDPLELPGFATNVPSTMPPGISQVTASLLRILDTAR
jgi:hypothetical protein